MSRAPAKQANADAIAWYVEQAESLLEQLRSRAQSLRSRAGQLAGFAAAVIALIGGNADRIIGDLCGIPRTVVGVALLVGTVLLVGALLYAVIGAAFRPHLIAGISAQEIANYTTERFTHEPDLWRVHIRTIRGLLIAIGSTTEIGDRAANALRIAVLLFLAGVLAVAVALGILFWELSI